MYIIKVINTPVPRESDSLRIGKSWRVLVTAYFSYSYGQIRRHCAKLPLLLLLLDCWHQQRRYQDVSFPSTFVPGNETA